MFKFTNRKSRAVIGVLTIVVLVLFVSLNIGYMFLASWDRSMDVIKQEQGKDQSKISVEISNIHADVNGNVNIELSLKIKELLEFIEGGPNKNGEATNNPVPRDVKFLINNPDVCSRTQALRYIIYIHTSPGNAEKRELLRSTWASTDLFNEHITERIFLMGMSETSEIQASVEKENEKYHDIIQGDFHDNYKNLTLKGLMGLKWLTTHCSKAKFAIKADDDAFVNIFRLEQFLLEKEKKEHMLACPLWSDNSMPILRDPVKCAKWCVRFNEFPGRRYFPQYCAGLTFILSNKLVSDMYKASKSTPFFWIDDVYITGLLVSKVKGVEFVKLNQNFTLKHDEALDNLRDEKKPLNHMLIHCKDSEQFIPMWSALLKRLTLDEVKRLSTDMIEKHPVLKRKLERGNL